MAEGPISSQISRKTLHGFPTVEADDSWYILLSEGSRIPIPGARYMKVKEFTRGRIRTTQRSGWWVELSKYTAHSNPDLLHWCRRHCNSELPSGNFRFSPKDWDRQAEDFISVPYFPELDHPNPLIRELAEAELFRRIAEHQLSLNREERDDLVRGASGEGYSRRELADLLGISFGRVQQVVNEETPRK